jgi:hypothetical protein
MAETEIKAGWWWALNNWNGDLEVVHIKENALSESFRVSISGTEEGYDLPKLLKEYELVERIEIPEKRLLDMAADAIGMRVVSNRTDDKGNWSLQMEDKLSFGLQYWL